MTDPAGNPDGRGRPAPSISGDAEGGAGETTNPRLRRRARLTALVGLLIGGAATLFVVRRIARDWDAAEQAIREADAIGLLVGLLLAVVTVLGQAVGWRTVLRLVGVRVARGRVVIWYLVGEIGKYLPGGVWPVLGRGELARRGGVPRTRAYASVVLSLALLYLGAMFVAVALLPFAVGGVGATPWMLVLLLLPVGIVLLHHRMLERIIALLSRVTGRSVDLAVPRWGGSLLVILRYAPTWITTGLATLAVARALDTDASPARIVFATTLSWIAGVVAVPVPAGAGVREAVFIASSGLDGGIGGATAIISRLIFAVVDGGGAGVAALLLRRGGGGATVEPLEPDPGSPGGAGTPDAS